MWTPRKIRFTNLFAHRDSTHIFNNNTCTIITGYNETNPAMENNGAGKTTLFEAISLALTNESLRGINKDVFINRDAEECLVDMEMDNETLHSSLRIVRHFYRGSKPVRVEVWENGERNAQITSVLEANKRILSLLGITKEDLFRYYIISQDSHYTFFTASDNEKKEIMNRITAADRVAPIVEKFREEGERVRRRREEEEEPLRKMETENEVMRELVEKLERVEIDGERVEEIEVEVGEMRRKNEKSEEVLRGYEKRLASLREEIERVKKTSSEENDKIDKSTKRVKVLQGAVEETRAYLRETRRMVERLEGEREREVKCPECGARFIAGGKYEMSPEEIEEGLKSMREEEKNLEKSVEEGERKLEEERKRIKGMVKEAVSLSFLLSEEVDLKNEIVNCKTRIEKRKLKIEGLEEEKRRIVNPERDMKRIEELRRKIAVNDKAIKTLSATLTSLREEEERMRRWSGWIGRSGFMTWLANQSIKLIEGATNSFLRRFGADISVIINGFKILKSGEVREKIDVFVSEDGRDGEVFLGKSGGERGRITLAGILGIHHLINLSTEGRGLNLLCMDEIFPSIDSKGQERIINVLKTLGITILLITQNVGDNFNVDNRLIVVKQNRVSRYLTDFEKCSFINSQS